MKKIARFALAFLLFAASASMTAFADGNGKPALCPPGQICQ